MAHLRTLKGRRKPYQVTYLDPDGRRRAQSFVRKIDAQRFVATQTVDVLRGEWVDPDAGRITVKQYADAWLETRAIRSSTRDRYLGYIHYIDRLGSVRLSQLTPSQVEQWQAGLARDMAASTASTIRNVFAGMLRTAVRDRVINRTPFDGVPTLRVERSLVVPLSVETVLAIRDTISESYRAAVMVGMGTGPRRGECLGLTVDRVDFLRRVITFDRQLIGATRDHKPIFGPPKTAASVRQVPAPQAVIDALAAHLAKFPPGDDGLIFRSPRGGIPTRAKFGQSWRDCPATPEGSRFHDLRHFYASRLIDQGESVKVVQARLGHATAGETLDTYGHLWPNNDESTRAAIDSLFERPESDTAEGKDATAPGM